MKVDIHIGTSNDDSVTMPVPCFTAANSALFVINRPYTSRGAVPGQWNITHKGTGLAVASGLHMPLNAVRVFAERLENLIDALDIRGMFLLTEPDDIKRVAGKLPLYKREILRDYIAFYRVGDYQGAALAADRINAGGFSRTAHAAIVRENIRRVAGMPVTVQTVKPGPRKLSDIASEIARVWRTPYFGALPYLRAMKSLSDLSDYYDNESAYSVVEYFLCNAGTWRGPDARRIKAELRAMLRGEM